MSKKITATNIVFTEARLSYCNLINPRPADANGPAKYDTMVIVSKKDTVGVALALEAIEAAKLEGKAKKGKWQGKVPANLKLIWKDGDAPENADVDDAVRGCYYFNASAGQKPVKIVDKRVQPTTSEEEVYSGVYANVSVNFYPYETNGNGITAGLKGVQVLGKGDHLDGSYQAPESVFDVLDEDDSWMN